MSPWMSRTLIIACMLMSLYQGTAQARLVVSESIDSIVGKSEILAVGEVVEIRRAATPSWKKDGQWYCYMNARIRVLRAVSGGAASEGTVVPKAGDILTLWYEVYDPDRFEGVMNGYMFPALSSGQILTFPLANGTVNGRPVYKLISREDMGLLLCSLKSSPEHPDSETPHGFLLTEITNVYAHGRYEDICNLSSGMNRHCTWQPGLSDELYARFAPQVESADRWLTMAAAMYNSASWPRKTISELTGGSTTTDNSWKLVAKVLAQVDKARLGDDFLGLTIRNAACSPSGSASTILDNFAGNPSVGPLVEERLKADDAGAIYIAYMLTTKGKADPTQPALDASMRFARRAIRLDVGLVAACELIREHGSDQQYKELLDTMGKTKDFDKYRFLWCSLSAAKDDRGLAAIRIGLADRRPLRKYTEYRICDEAAWRLQVHTGVEFGAKMRQYGDRPDASLQERDAAVTKAMQWMEEHRRK